MGVKFGNGKYYIDEDYIIKRQELSAGASSHTHDFIELVYLLKGHCVHIIDGKEYPAGRGDMAFINYNSVHAIPPGKGAQYINILIKPEFIDQSLKGSENAFSILAIKGFRNFADTVQRSHSMINFSGKERNEIEDLLDRIDSELLRGGEGSELVIRSCINILLIMVFRKMELPMKENIGVGNELLEYIKTNCSGSLSLEKAACKAGYNPSYFSRIFKRYTGTTFSRYLTDCRINVAKELLENSQMSVENVMYEAGFSDRTKFFKDFNGKMGVSPLQYRKMKKESKEEG